ncbi:MAG: hypothetical protein AAFV53_41325 [Myxococcota bacterium]
MRLLSGFVSACLLIFGATWTGLFFLTVALRPHRAWLVIGLLFWKTPLFEYADRVEVLKHKPDWTVRDKAGVWILNCGMAIGGASLGLFEIAMETTLLAVPGSKVRTFRSDFPTRSRKIRGVVSRWKRSLPRTPTRTIQLPKRRVSWAYRWHDWEENRVALALNPPTLHGTATPVGGRWRLDVCAHVTVNYAPDYALLLFSVDGRDVVIEEGLFFRLGQEGWLFPYEARWCWTEHHSE